ncbi:hypothetical protein RND81_14G205600 [Saponaria officinalis]|uniref:F-box associated beta-propeller type 1 domain-containing protein n=1 Tax=Saponaria officinalis TaxID=3572 RepID=A0AAW1GSS8_SAPOF
METSIILPEHVIEDILLSTPDFERDIPPVVVNEGDELCNHQMRCIGLVNGIVCLLWGRSRFTRLVLWNPATREFKDVPRWPIMPDDKDAEKFGPIIHGFGFDVQSNDFILLIGMLLKVTTSMSSMYSYFNNGVHYWLAHELPYIPNGIVSFNFSSETFKEFESPVAAADTEEILYSLSVGKYKEGLALLMNRSSKNEESFEIWAATEFRDDNEVPSAWQLVVKVPPIHLHFKVDICTIRDSGALLLYINEEEWDDVPSADSGAYLYNLSTHTFKYLGSRFISSFRYVESLFPLSRRLI